MSPHRFPVSTITGRRQRVALRAVSATAWGLAGLGVMLGESSGVVASAAVVIVVAAPLVRIAWLVVRWVQERDLRFVVLGLALLGVIALGGAIALWGG